MLKRIPFALLMLIASLISAQNLSLINDPQAAQILQDRGEIIFTFQVEDKEIINSDLTNIISIDQVTPLPDGPGYSVRAYANSQEFQTFLTRNIPYTIQPKSFAKALTMATTVAQMASWDRYPTYSVYTQMMAQFVTNYPGLCDLDTILASTPSGNYKILVLKISDNINSAENEPQFLYTSSIHGDETTGYILLLRLIDYLLSNYGVLPKVTNLVDNAEIWICPLSNPEGTYRYSSPAGSTVQYSVRYNLSNVDLNRNYPDPRAGQHPDGNSWQPETQAFMTFASSHHFNAAGNFHGGAEVTNYPWDTWTTSGNINADRLWWERVCKSYVDTTRLITPTYMTDVVSDGVTEGGDWYVITGGRQDYMNWWHHCREVTIELDVTKTTGTENLNTKWNQNYRSLLNYLQESLYGVRGVITDSCTGQPIRAKVWVNSYDQNNDSSLVYSALPVGNYHRYMIAGTYSITYSATGYVSKTVNNIVLSNGAATVVNVQLMPTGTYTPSISIAASPGNVICSGASVTFTATPANEGSSPNYQWKVNGVNAGSNSNTFISSSLNQGDVVSCVLTSSLACAVPATATSNAITMTVNPSLTPAVSVNASATTICAGTNVVFTPTPTNGGSPSYQWFVNGSASGSGSTYSNSSLNQGDAIYCIMTSTASCASPLTATSNTVSITVTPTVTPSVSISASSNNVCSGTNITFTPSAVNGGTPTYQWFVNSSPAGTGSTYSSSSLSDGDQVSCVMTSTANCASPVSATSNTVSMVISSNVTPAVSITSSTTTICPGTNVTFTPTPVNGGTPIYQWFLNASPVASGSTYSNSSLADGDQVRCLMTSSESCASPPNASSNVINITVNPNVTPTVSISATATTICDGTNVIFTPSPVNGGSPAYQWYINGIPAGSGNTFNSSSLSHNDQVSCIMTSTANCASPLTATSNVVNMTVNPTVTPSISISASSSTICTGSTVTFTPNPTNGGTPGYQWLINGNPSGTGNSLVSSSLNDGDVITCQMTSTANCASPLTVSSNSITMNVTTSVTPSVYISTSASTICSGTNAVFTPSPVNGGSPSYQWFLNGFSAGSGSTYSNNALADGDQITCIMTSSESCASPTTASSNTITMAVNPSVTPSLSINASATSICTGSTVTFTPSPVNGGSPSYQWYINGISAGNGSTLISSTLNQGDGVFCVMNSTVSCASPSIAVSNSITMTVQANVTPTLSLSTNPALPVCPGTGITINTTPEYPGSSPTYQWTIDGLAAGNTSSLSGYYNDGQVINCTMTSNESCVTSPNATSPDLTISLYSTTPVIVTENLGSLLSSAVSGNQWFEQSTGIIAGAIQQSYTPSSNGYYYTVVTDSNGCIDTSNIFHLLSVGLSPNESLSTVLIYPNPGKGLYLIELPMQTEEPAIEVYNETGQLILKEFIPLTEGISGSKQIHRLDLRSFPKGIYFLRIITQNDTRILQLSHQ